MMAEVRQEQKAEGLDLLLQLTEDRGQLITSLRGKYFASGAGLGEEEKTYLFELTELFARMVYLVHEWGESWRI